MKGFNLKVDNLCSVTGGTQTFIKSLTGRITNLSDLNPGETVKKI